MSKCTWCNGTGETEDICYECEGDTIILGATCFECNGEGYIVEDCIDCNGTGELEDE